MPRRQAGTRKSNIRAHECRGFKRMKCNRQSLHAQTKSGEKFPENGVKFVLVRKSLQ